MRVLVTGGAGFIGGNLCRRLADIPTVDSVLAFDDLSTGGVQNLSDSGAALLVGDLLDFDLVRDAAKDCDVIIHLGARPSVAKSVGSPLLSHQSNATGTLHVLEAARLEGVEHVILASSSSVYGANPQIPKSEELRLIPMSPYAASKAAAESYASSYWFSYGSKVLTLRFFNVFGPLQPAGHDYAAVIPAFIDAALRGLPVQIYGDGHQSRDFTFVGSVCEVIIDAVKRRVHDEGPVNLAFGERVTLIELLEMLEGIVNRRLARVYLPPRPGDVRHSQADSRRLLQLFPDAAPVPLEVGLRQTVDWFRSGCGPLCA